MGRFIKNANIRGADQYVVRIPYGESTVRPVNPNDGQTRFNTTTGILEVYYNNSWQNFTMVGNTTVVKDTFTGDGSSIVFGAMSYAYSSGEETQPVVFVDNVHQNPNVAYTFDSSFAITFTSPPPSGKTIIVLHNYASTDYTGAPFVAPFLPSDLSNLEAWNRFNVGITQAGGFVSKWDDQSANDRHWTQVIGSLQPSVSAGIITFDGIDNVLHTPFVLAQPFTIYMRINLITWVYYKSLLGYSDSSNIRLNGPGGATTANCVAYFGGSHTATDTVDDLQPGQWQTLVAVVNGASSLIYLDGQAEFSGDMGSNNWGNVVDITLGAQLPTGAGSTNISMKEVLVYSGVHDANTRAQVTTYLGAL